MTLEMKHMMTNNHITINIGTKYSKENKITLTFYTLNILYILYTKLRSYITLYNTYPL